MRIFISMLVSLSFSLVFACDDIRLDKDPKVLGKVPAWDQGENGTCWAFSAAQLIDAWRFSNGDQDFDHLTSPLMVAVDGVNHGAGSYSWGDLAKAVKVVREKGSCNAKQVSDHLGGEKASQLIENLEEIHSLTRPVMTMSDYLMSRSKVSSFSFGKAKPAKPKGLPEYHVSPEESRRSKVEAARKCSLYLARIGVDAKMAPGLDNVILAALELDRVSFTKEILSFICKGTKSMQNLPDLQSSYPPENEWPTAKRNLRLQELLDEKLKAKKPMAVNFCYSGVLSATSQVRPTQGARCDDESDHYAIVVGSAKKSFGKCEYLVRDSYCSQYQKKTGKKICEDGQHWMTADQLLKNTKGLLSF